MWEVQGRRDRLELRRHGMEGRWGVGHGMRRAPDEDYPS